MNKKAIELLQCTLRGAAQVMFQESALTGALFLVGIFWGAFTSSMVIGWGALVGLIVSTLTGMLLGRPLSDGKYGLWSFNGILVGCALPTLLGNTPAMWFALIFGSALTVPLREAMNNLLRPHKINSLTAPFVLMTWIVVLASHAMHSLSPETTAHHTLAEPLTSNATLAYVTMWLRGISQVFLIDSWVTGVVLLVGLFVANRWAALWAAIGSALSIGMALLMGASPYDTAHGLYSFSGVLTAIALGSIFYKPSWRSAIWSFCGIVFTLFIQVAMDILLSAWSLPTLTAPFCIATWLMLLPRLELDKVATDHSSWHGKREKA